ncbi:uncharacterized protein BT62DRAFT_1004707 [Guyanagaster necrorhizus]|uniref:Arrestin-like N-terminal domain-containing protein n=1 Tax=Guyanagaster necrorhizus TaxID=856835 RepID=A0A9P7VWG1_9AGAR|nr:uncharacterized protein BT62DRAFT_1004707 [Guyanagaster necrorhizus MCA 3950]KAG7447131.1 hypothetical protein BT62DRAFT_1004707 [Guyanagaster necrorhizus MCA 3950]
MLTSSRARNSEQIPTILEGDDITGSLTFCLEKEEAIDLIRIKVQGQISTVPLSTSSWNFLDIIKVLWSKDMGDPNMHPTSPLLSGKLVGTHEWHFSIPIPKEVTFAPGFSPYLTAENLGPFPLPQPFHEMNVPTTVQYALIASIKRPGRFRGNAKHGVCVLYHSYCLIAIFRIQTTFGYVPMMRPGPPSILRQLAYRGNSPLPGPEVDPEGRQQLPPALLNGTIFKDREVELQCLFYLAKPLSYTRGTSIPCIAAIRCSDRQALGLLATPSSIPMRLRRSVTLDLPSSSTELRDRGIRKDKHRWRDVIQDFGSCIWWTSGDQGSCRRLEGEIKLWEGLKPTCDFGNFKVQYSVVVLPFSAAAFVPANQGSLLVEQTITIGTVYAPGPRPVFYTTHTEFPFGQLS